ncbi:MAG TPA: hypothetical protein VH083_13660 [Myxococcales bacterium]|jgi:hypothetical protein|nr:hypothetical protein [Myxococcales bacterium]
MKTLLCFFLFGCATTAVNRTGEIYDRPAAANARVEVLELGWDSVEDPQVGHPPVVDVKSPRHYRGLVLEQAQDLAQRCNTSALSFEQLARASGPQANAESKFVKAGSQLAYRDAALRLKVGECTAVEGPASDFVVKRVE